MKRIAFFHEDDYCQLELLPLDSERFCMKQMNEIDNFAEEHRDGPFFTDMYMREASPHPIRELNLQARDLEEALKFLPAYDEVESGYSTYREKCENTYARGIQHEIAVFWSVDEDNIINSIWLDSIWIGKGQKDSGIKILASLGKLAPLLLADWEWGVSVNLTNSDEINIYIEDKIKVFSKSQL